MKKEIVELREVINKLVPLLAGKHIKVTQRGVEAKVKVDPRTRKPIEVNIPSISDNATPEFVRAIQGFVDHEVGHVLITDWSVASAYEKSEPRKSKRERVMGFHNIVEDTFVEREYIKTYPGSSRHLKELRHHFIDRVTKVALARAADDKEKFSYLLVPVVRALAGQQEFKDFLDEGEYWDNPFVKELVGKLKPATLNALPRLTSTRHTLMVAKELDNILYPNEADPDEEESEEQESQSKGKGKKEHKKNSKNASGGDAGEGNAQDDSDASGKSGGKGKGDKKSKPSKEDEDEEKSQDDAGDPSESEEKSQNPAADTNANDSGDDGEDKNQGDGDDAEDGEEDQSGAGKGDDGEDEEGQSYTLKSENNDDHDIDGGDEDSESVGGGSVGGGVAKSMFDFDDDAFSEADLAKQISIDMTNDAVQAMSRSSYNVYSRENDKIEPLQIPGDLNSKFVPMIDEQSNRMIGKMQKDIERMMAAQALAVRVPGFRSGRLQSSNLHRVMANDDRVFNRKHEHRTKATAVTLLIDNSGSMFGKKVEVAMVAAYALAQTLERVGIPCEMLGFTTGGYAYSGNTMSEADQKVRYNRTCSLIMPIYKSFDERVNSIVKQRIAHMAYNQPGMNANVDGECLEYAAMRLMKRREPRKVLMVLSDGQPAGAHNATDHLKTVVEDLTKSGLDMVGIGIMDESVKHYYPKHMVLRAVEDLPSIVMNELKRVLTT